MPRIIIALAAAGVVCLATVPTASGQTVWSGYDFSFTKADFAHFSLPENQDRISDIMWISRDVNGGIFNVFDEDIYDLSSPSDTEWATYINNPTDTIAATNHANLTFQPWIAAYGGQGGANLPARLTGGNAVLHLITDDIYLDLRFTSWTQQGGGGFSYDRALPPEGPDTTGDYNLDGFVNAADYVHWRKTLNNPADPDGSGADGDGDGTIDPDDYDFWVEHYGETVPTSSAAAAVPEPTSLALIVFTILLRMTVRHRPKMR